jgi:hypothetical protein
MFLDERSADSRLLVRASQGTSALRHAVPKILGIAVAIAGSAGAHALGPYLLRKVDALMAGWSRVS